MKTAQTLVIALAAILIGAAAIATEPPPAPVTLSGPYVHDNLAIYLVHQVGDGGDGQNTNRPLLALADAMAQGKVVVHETGEVNELLVENLSASEDIYIQAGDIVKGGKQDRVLAVDLILPPKSGRMPIASFCVEAGRWTERGDEPVGAFASAEDAIAGKDMKMAAKAARSQDQVWDKVQQLQEKLSVAIAEPVASEMSPSSMQLTLENEELGAAVAAYVAALAPTVEAEPKAAGFVYAVNGRLVGAELYRSPRLFRSLWSKLLKSSAVEAVAEQTGVIAAPPESEAVHAFLAEAADGPEQRDGVTERITLVTYDGDKAVLFETRDAAADGLWVHRSYVVK